MRCKPGSGRQGEEEKREADDGLTPSFMGLPGVQDFVMNDVRVPCSLNIILQFAQPPRTHHVSFTLGPNRSSFVKTKRLARDPVNEIYTRSVFDV